MVQKGLKVGDTFQDGGRAYKVLSVNEDGTYSSKAIEKDEIPEVVETEEEIVAGEKKYTKTEINRMSKDELSVLVKEFGVEAETVAEMKKQIIEKMDIQEGCRSPSFA